MNSEEGMSMAKMAVTVLLVVLVIGAVVAIVYAAYSWFGSGTDKLTDNVNSIQASQYSQYDNSQVSGSDVLAALKNYRDSDMCIFISNLNNQNKEFRAKHPGSLTAYNYCVLAEDTDSSFKNTKLAIDKDNGNWYIGGSRDTAVSRKFKDEDMVDLDKNTNMTPTTTQGNADCYVKSTATWYAQLVYDNTDDVCGILFRQMN